MTHGWVRLVAAGLFTLITSAGAFAQGSSTASISGVVIDSDGGVIPGATIVVKNIKTGESFNTVSSGAGTFSIPALITGTYTVTVSLEGFKTALLNNVVVNSGVPASVRATLEVGGLTEQVTVQANSELVQTQSAAVSTVLDTRQVQSLPLSSRDASQFVVFLPGVTSPGGSRDSTVNGLPQSTINMTLDGVNIQDNTLRRPTASSPSCRRVSMRLRKLCLALRHRARKIQEAAPRRFATRPSPAPTSFTAACSTSTAATR
jgi:hypothetical protein